MVSKQDGTLCSRKRDFTIFGDEFHNYSFKKLKHEDQSQKAQTGRSISFDIELHLHTKGYSKASDEDNKTCLKHPVIVERPKMSLDLELNLSPSYSSTSKTESKKDQASDHNETVSLQGITMMNPRIETNSRPSPSWLAFEGVDDEDIEDKEQEMVTTVCMKCHMLIMLSTSTPVCPNCKFMHPHDHNNSTKQFKPSNLLKLLC